MCNVSRNRVCCLCYRIALGAILSLTHSLTHCDNFSFLQIGRSADSAIDFVVVETVTGEDRRSMYKSNSTVSRYACRIQCDRRPPYTARLFAAAFDTRGKIQLSVSDVLTALICPFCTA